MRALLATMALVLGTTVPALAQTTTGPIRVGVMNDQSGPYADQTGVGSVVAARMAVEEVGGTVLGRPIEILSGDHMNKPDIGSSIAKRWIEQENVVMLADLPTSSVALAVQEIARAAGRIVLYSGAATADLTGKACAPLSAHWTYDTYAMAAGTGAAVTRAGGDTWFLMAADYAFGVALTRDVSAAVTKNGGKIVGVVKHPLGGSDFSSYLLQAQASGAKVIGLLNAGADTTNFVKQAAEFGLTGKGQVLTGMVIGVVDTHSLGLKTAQGLEFTESFYWDQDDATRAWSKLFMAKHGRMPTSIQAGTYSATRHWLKAVKEAGTTDGPAVMAVMRRTPVEDMMTHGARIREDGRLMRDFYLFQAKRPEESKGEWDLHKLIRTVPAEEAARPLSEGGCPLVKS